MLSLSLALDAVDAVVGARRLVLLPRGRHGLGDGPSTAAVMGAVPAEKSGVASAMNDVSRQVSGALGVAVIGSLTSSLYASRIEDDTAALAPAAAETARESVGGAIGVAGASRTRRARP